MIRSQTLGLREGITRYATGFVTQEAINGLYGDVLHITGAPVPTSTNFEFAVFDKGSSFDLVNTEIGDNDPEGPLLTYGGSKTQGSLVTNGAHTDWYPVTGDVSDADLLCTLQEGAQLGTHRMLLSRLNQVVTIMNAAAGTATIDSTSTSTKVGNLLKTHVNTVRKACGGFCDIALLWGPDAWRAVSEHADILQRSIGTGSKDKPGEVSLATMDMILGLGAGANRQSNAVYNSATKGQTATPAFLLSNVVYIAARSRTPNRIDPGAVKLFQGRGSDGALLTPIYYKHASGTHEQAKWHWKEKAVATNAGALMKVTITV